MLEIAPTIEQKIKIKHQVTPDEVLEAFANRDGGLLEDAREKNRTIPPTQWFIAETHMGRLLKIVFIQHDGKVHLKSAYGPNDEEIRIYNKYK